MVVSVVGTREILDGYLDALIKHEDFARFFSIDVLATLEGIEPQYFRGKEAVRDWILGAHALGEVKVIDIFACEAHAGSDFKFIRKDGVAVPYSVNYDIADEKITALRLYFTAPIA